MTLDDFIELFSGYEPFPDLMLMEYVDAPEITVDLFADKGDVVFHQTRTREEFLTGLAMAFKTIDRPELVELTRKVVRHLDLDYYQSVQWIGGRLLEINPRVSTFVYQEDFIIPYLGIKYTLGELSADDVTQIQARVRTTRKSVRYYDQVFWDGQETAGTDRPRPDDRGARRGASCSDAHFTPEQRPRARMRHGAGVGAQRAPRRSADLRQRPPAWCTRATRTSSTRKNGSTASARSASGPGWRPIAAACAAASTTCRTWPRPARPVRCCGRAPTWSSPPARSSSPAGRAGRSRAPTAHRSCSRSATSGPTPSSPSAR
jgi:hypothetical protein